MTIDDLLYSPIPVADEGKTFKELCDEARERRGNEPSVGQDIQKRKQEIEDQFKHLRGKLIVRDNNIVHKELADKACAKRRLAEGQAAKKAEEDALILRVYNMRRIRRTRYGRR